MTVQPWEPVSHQWEVRGTLRSVFGSVWKDRRICERAHDVDDSLSLHVTLANGQKIIVRAKR